MPVKTAAYLTGCVAIVMLTIVVVHTSGDTTSWAIVMILAIIVAMTVMLSSMYKN